MESPVASRPWRVPPNQATRRIAHKQGYERDAFQKPVEQQPRLRRLPRPPGSRLHSAGSRRLFNERVGGSSNGTCARTARTSGAPSLDRAAFRSSSLPTSRRHGGRGGLTQAFEAVRYPILPKVTQLESEAARREILEIRHSSLYAPRDFDISPYFTIVKPTLLEGFNYKSVHWADLPAPSPASRHVWAAQEPSVP
jgi:hypothetical protein